MTCNFSVDFHYSLKKTINYLNYINFLLENENNWSTPSNRNFGYRDMQIKRYYKTNTFLAWLNI